HTLPRLRPKPTARYNGRRGQRQSRTEPRPMPTINVEAQLSRDDLLKAARQLSPAEFQQFVAGVLDLRAERQNSRLTAPEADLLLRINAGLPADLCERSRQLGEKRDTGKLTADEHAE